MTTPLEQIKERLEKMKKNPPQDACYQSWTPQEVEDANIYDSAISNIQEILPSIIQEVVDAVEKMLIAELPKEDEQGREKLKDMLASLKEESK